MRPGSQAARRRSAKALHAGANPAQASSKLSPDDGTGIHATLKMSWS